MNFTDSPFEKMMQEVPPAPRPVKRKAPIGSPCRVCSHWQGMPCVGMCYRELMLAGTSGQVDPKLAGGRSNG